MEIQKRIAGAKLATIDASHLSNIGQPKAYADLVLGFLTRTKRPTPHNEEPMPIANAHDGCPINYEVEGPASAPVLMLCNSLGTDLHMWDEQARDLVASNFA